LLVCTSLTSFIQVHIPLDNTGSSKGFVLIKFEDPSAAVKAYHNTDGEPFQGRLLHVLPAAAKRENKLDEFAIAKLPFKKQNLIKKKAEASTSTFNWNSLYMSQDAVNSSMADRLGVSKSELLDPTSVDAGVKQAIAETSIIQETKAYFANNGVDLNAFKKRERGDTTILVKNFPYGMSIDQLKKMFEEFGQILRVLMPPSGTIAIVEFAQAPQARAAFASLAYRRMQNSVLFLEKAPKGLFTNVSVSDTSLAPKARGSIEPKPSAADLLEREAEITVADTSTLFVRNLDFSTTSVRLIEVFKPLDGFMSARVNTKTDPKKPGQVLSMGFGFVEFRSKTQAQAALKAMDGYNLDGHKLIIKASNKGLDAAEERRKEDQAKKLAGKRTKIIIKNLPFEASKKDVRALFGTYGQLRSVRVPKKFDHSARGFAFADFVSAREAENALEALRDTHLLGRRLVLEFAVEDTVDAEEEIKKMQKKVGKQVSKVALLKLTGGGRKKFNIEGNEDENDQ
jgi:multiple RNA-binding domain-containing protein 1